MIRDGEVYYFDTTLPDGTVMKNRFNYEHYMKYYKIKREGVPRNDRIPDHPMLGTVFRRSDGVLCIIETVSKHWHFGYYEHIVFRMHNTRSHGTMVMKNISSACDVIIESAGEFAQCVILSPFEVPEETISLEVECDQFD